MQRTNKANSKSVNQSVSQSTRDKIFYCFYTETMLLYINQWTEAWKNLNIFFPEHSMFNGSLIEWAYLIKIARIFSALVHL